MTQTIFIVLGFSQLGFLSIYLESNYLFLILIYLTLLETLIISYKTIHSKSILSIYSFYLLLKYIFSSLMFLSSSSYIDYYFLITFQLLFFFFNIDTVSIYRKKSIKILSFLFILTLSTTMFIINNGFFSFLFLIYLISVYYILKNKVIREQNGFCQNKQFTPNLILRKIKQLPISFASVTILTFFGLIYYLNLDLVTKITLSIILVFTILYEYRQFFRGWFSEFDSSKILKYYILSIVFFIVYLLLFWLTDIQIDKESFKDYSTNVFNTISNIAILNIASLFIILQLNYSKYGSSYLLYKILKSLVLLIITFLPSIIYICSFYFLKLEEIQYNIIPSLLILSYLSTLGLFFYTYVFMETHNLLEKLFKDVTYEDFNSYKNNIIQTKERNIDSILIITNKVINNNDTPTSHSLFFYLFCWLDINITKVKDQDRSYQTRQNNKFYNFLILIVENIVLSNNSIQKNFLIAIREMIMFKVNSKNYMDYSLIYRVLFSYLRLSLKNKNEEISNLIYDVIYFQTSSILLNLKRFDYSDNDILEYNKDYTTMNDFESVFIEELYDIARTAIKYDQKDFLYHCRFNNSFFILYNKGNYDFSKWDGKIIEVYKHLKGPRYEIDRYVVKNVKFYSIYLSDYEYLFKSDGKTSIYKYELLQKYVFNDLKHIYLYCIENNLIKSESDFHIFWSSILDLKYKKEYKVIINLISIFTYLFDKLVEKYIDEKENEYIIYSVFQRVLQIKSYDKELNLKTRKFINHRIDILLEKYPKLKYFVNNDKNSSSNLIRDIDLIKDFDIELKNTEVDYQI